MNSKASYLASLASILVTLSVWNSPAADSAATPARESLCVMTYNLRYASPTGSNAWPDRRPLMRRLIIAISPDLLGTQEGLYSQLQDLAADLPEYDWAGVGRDDGGKKGEFMAVFYRKSRLQALSTNHFWLSDTPEVAGSSTWGNANRRMVTWLKFLDRQTQKEFYHLNTHFDHQIQLARQKSAELVRQRVALFTAGAPVLLTGDFNAEAGKNRAYQLLVKDDFFRDTWSLAKIRRGEELGTFNGFKAVPTNGVRIDWVLVRGHFEVDAAEVVPSSYEGKFPSDHCPVVVRLSMNR